MYVCRNPTRERTRHHRVSLCQSARPTLSPRQEAAGLRGSRGRGRGGGGRGAGRKAAAKGLGEDVSGTKAVTLTSLLGKRKEPGTDTPAPAPAADRGAADEDELCLKWEYVCHDDGDKETLVLQKQRSGGRVEYEMAKGEPTIRPCKGQEQNLPRRRQRSFQGSRRRARARSPDDRRERRKAQNQDQR